MNYLKALVVHIRGNTYSVKNIKEKVPWTELKKNIYFKSIVICLLKGSDGYRDHTVSISNAWIFDSNLNFALPLNKESLD